MPPVEHLINNRANLFFFDLGSSNPTKPIWCICRKSCKSSCLFVQFRHRTFQLQILSLWGAPLELFYMHWFNLLKSIEPIDCMSLTCRRGLAYRIELCCISLSYLSKPVLVNFMLCCSWIRGVLRLHLSLNLFCLIFLSALLVQMAIHVAISTFKGLPLVAN